MYQRGFAEIKGWLTANSLIQINVILRIFTLFAIDQLTIADAEIIMQIEDKLLGVRFGYSVMVILIIAANMLAQSAS